MQSGCFDPCRPGSAGTEMLAVFRVDASIEMGTGHVMRCLTLAKALRAHGIDSEFISRCHTGNLIDFIEAQGFPVHVLAEKKSCVHEYGTSRSEGQSMPPAHFQWLGVTLQEDCDASLEVMSGRHADWLIVDHYALDIEWERQLKPFCKRVMVIDDLADRRHECDLLLDQTYGRREIDYAGLVPDHANILSGSGYALLRPEFYKLRSESLKRREQNSLHEILISMGGVDKDNVTGRILQFLAKCTLPADCRITVVMGRTAPWLNDVRILAERLNLSTRVLVGVEDMAQLMANSDLAIGAAGATTWERCCLGLPSIMLILAENQRNAALLLERDGVARLVDSAGDFQTNFSMVIKELFDSKMSLSKLSARSSRVVDGEGCRRVVSAMLQAVHGNES